MTNNHIIQKSDGLGGSVSLDRLAESLENNPGDSLPKDLSSSAFHDPLPSMDWSRFNHILHYPTLRNTYYAMRHGLSESNRLRVTATKPAVALTGYGLTEEGRRQVREQALKAKVRRIFSEATIVLSSDFLRAMQSAEIFADVLRASPPIPVAWLRERCFGELDNSDPDEFFPNLHPVDVVDPFNNAWGCESPVSLQSRVSRGISQLEAEHSGLTILLVTHHDTLEVLEAVFAKRSPGEYAGRPEEPQSEIDNAELRRLEFVGFKAP